MSFVVQEKSVIYSCYLHKHAKHQFTDLNQSHWLSTGVCKVKTSKNGLNKV